MDQAHTCLSAERNLVINVDVNFTALESSLNLSANHVLTNLSATFETKTPANILHIVCVTCFAITVMISTVFGNVLVIVAVSTEKRLRKVGNSFIVSLALSDLLVGVVVTPFALAYELLGDWPLGAHLCDLWVSMDVICCTASIINLCIISFDRYNAITRPLRYALKRTLPRAFTMIAIGWIYSAGIAIPPLLGWRQPVEQTTNQCMVSQDRAYTVFSTTGAFYLPLMVMLVMYFRVYRATMKRQKLWVPGHGSHHVSLREKSAVLSDSGSSPPFSRFRKLHSRSSTDHESSVFKIQDINPHIGCKLMLHSNSSDTGPVSPGYSYNSASQEKRQSRGAITGGIPIIKTTRTDGSTSYRYSTSTLDSSSRDATESRQCTISLSRVLTSSGEDCNDDPASSSFMQCKPFRREGDGTAADNNTRLSSIVESSPSVIAMHTLAPPPQKRRNTKDDSSVDSSEFESIIMYGKVIRSPRIKRKNRKNRRKSKISVTQERRAARTLGIIMGCFILCWLPFFLVALIRPFCVSCQFPSLITSIITWLGYSNSALNPVIYTFFNQDFRRAFARILFCRKCCNR